MDYDEIELDMLRDFYEKWEHLHQIPDEKIYRNKKELAAQQLVDAVHTLRNFNRPAKTDVLRRVNGTKDERSYDV